MEKRTALVLGASGLVGQEVTRLLLASSRYRSVTVLVRKKLDWKHEKLRQQLVDFAALEQYESVFSVHDVYSCLGTTIKKAKTKENFWKVDYEYTMSAARLSQQKGVHNFLTVSSIGANPRSIFFYSQVKGRVEEDLKKLSLQGLHIFRPSLLLGEREEVRLGERVAEKFFGIMPFLFTGPLHKYRPIAAEQVAKAMCKAALRNMIGVHIYESNDIANMQ